MYLSKLCDDICEITKEECLYIHSDVKIYDFTKKNECNLIINSKSGEIQIPLNDFKSLSKLLSFDFGDSNKLIITWDIKEILTYFKFNQSFDFDFKCQLFDLRLAESFLGITLNKPNSLNESITRITILKNKKLYNVHKKIHIPLATQIIPNIEVIPIKKEIDMFSYYEIEGTVNGRMKCSIPSYNFINPHSLAKDDKNIKTTLNGVFVHFDFQSMEACVLQKLSGDEHLKTIIDSEKDIYNEVWNLISGKQSNVNARNLAKKLFLPVIYGMQPNGLIKSFEPYINLSFQTAKSIIQKLKSFFPQAFEYVENYKMTNDFFAEDYIGRRRCFKDDGYKLRNFLIQSPASIICLEKLINLFYKVNNLGRIMFSIHDGYSLETNFDNLDNVLSVSKSVLETESEFVEGLKLKVNYQFNKDYSKI